MNKDLSGRCRSGGFDCDSSECVDMKNICIGWCIRGKKSRLCRVTWKHKPNGLCYHHTNQGLVIETDMIAYDIEDVLVLYNIPTPSVSNSVYIRHRTKDSGKPLRVLGCGVFQKGKGPTHSSWDYVRLQSAEHLQQIIRKNAKQYTVKVVVHDTAQ